jgi:hypothetical protein
MVAIGSAEGLGSAKIGIMWEAAWFCEDDTAFLPSGPGGSGETEMGRRSLERHLPQLGKRHLLVAGDVDVLPPPKFHRTG